MLPNLLMRMKWSECMALKISPLYSNGPLKKGYHTNKQPSKTRNGEKPEIFLKKEYIL